MSKKLKVLIPIILGVILIIIVALAAYGNYLTKEECKNRLTEVQNGYLGNYNMVSVKEVLEYTWQDGKWDSYDSDDIHIVEYALEQKNKIQFAVNDEDKSFEVVYFKTDSTVIDKAISVKQYLDDFYKAYGHENMNRGIVIDYSIANDTMLGKMEPITKLSVLTASDDWDMSEYLNESMKSFQTKVNLELTTEDDGLSFTNEAGTIQIITDGEGNISILQMKEDIETPPLFGLKVGGDINKLSLLTESDFVIVSEVPNPNNNSMVTINLWRRDTSDALSCTYSNQSMLISELIYEKEAIGEDTQREIILKENVDVDACIDIVKNYSINEEKVIDLMQGIFDDKGTWNGSMMEDGSVEVSFSSMVTNGDIYYEIEVHFVVTLDNTVNFVSGIGQFRDYSNNYEEDFKTETEFGDFVLNIYNSINNPFPVAGNYDWYSDSYFVSKCNMSLLSGSTNTFFVEAYDSEGFYITFYDNGKCTVEQADGARNCTWEYDGSNISVKMDSQTLYLYKTN